MTQHLLHPPVTDSHRLSKPTLGIITGTTGWRDSAGQVWINHSIGRLCEALRERMGPTRICLPILSQHQGNLNHKLAFPPEDIADLPPLISTIKAQLHYLPTVRALRSFENSVDVLFIRLPFQLPRALVGLQRPKLLHVVGSPQQVIRASSDYSGVMKFLARKFAAHSERAMKRMVAEPFTRTCTNGGEMWERLRCKQGRIVVSSCLLSEEIRPRVDFTLHNPPRLLFVGYLRPEKGVLVLIEAFEKLRRERPLAITLVGGSDRSTGVEAAISQRVNESEFCNDITQVGMLKYDNTLFELFRSHDILVQPSLSEGTPRTLVEARAFGCPVIASNVGGIPASVQHDRNGLLVEPGDATQLSSAIARLLDNDSLRLKLIHESLEHRHELTLEYFADTLVSELRLLTGDLVT